MQVNAINSLSSFNSINFEGKKDKNKVPAHHPVHVSNGFMSKVKAPLLAVMFIPVTAGLTSCEKDIDVSAYASASASVLLDGDTGCCKDSTAVVPDTTVVEPVDTTDIEFPYAMTDSLYKWVNDYLDIPIGGDDGGNSGIGGNGGNGDGTGKGGNLTYLYGERDWHYQRPESISLNLEKSKGQSEAVYYDYILNDAESNMKITNVASGDLTIVKKDGTETDNITGLLIKTDDGETFMHSNGKDRIYVYPKATSGENKGKYVELGYAEHGYLYNPDGSEIERYGQNVALYDILAEGTEDHYINVKGEALTNEEIQEKLKDAMKEE